MQSDISGTLAKLQSRQR